MLDVRERVELTARVNARPAMAADVLRSVAQLLALTHAVPDALVDQFAAIADRIDALREETQRALEAAQRGEP